MTHDFAHTLYIGRYPFTIPLYSVFQAFIPETELITYSVVDMFEFGKSH